MQLYKIVILDDDLDEILLLRDSFQKKGIEFVKYFIDGEKCMQYLEGCTQEELPNVIITDLNMPRVSGYDFLKWIKARPRYQHIPVVVYFPSTTCSPPASGSSLPIIIRRTAQNSCYPSALIQLAGSQHLTPFHRNTALKPSLQPGLPCYLFDTDSCRTRLTIDNSLWHKVYCFPG